MRYDVNKYLFVGLSTDKDAFFKKAQELGIIHFIQKNVVAIKEFTSETSIFVDAIKVLRGLPPVEQEETDNFILAERIAKQINELHNKLEKLAEEERMLHLEIARVEVFGDFDLDDIRKIEQESKRKVQFFGGKQGAIVPQPEMAYVGSEHGLDYFMALNKEPRTYERMIEVIINRPVGMLRKRLHEVYREKRTAEQALKELARYKQLMHHALINKLNRQNLHVAQNLSQQQLDGNLFAVEGWVPVNKIDQVQQLVQEMHVHAEEIAVEKDETAPTFLDNSGYTRIGEDLVHIYDTPSNTDKDPSLWVLWFFALFFAMIVGDAGYGLVFLGIALYLRYKIRNPKPLGKRLIKLIFILGGSCVIWGILINSFFGISIDMDSPLRKVSIIQWLVEKKVEYHMERKDAEYEYWVKEIPALKNATTPHQFVKEAVKVHDGKVTYELFDTYAQNIMLELALIIGIVHVIISFLRYIKRNPVGIGWILVIIGGYLYAPTFIGGTSIFYFLTNLNIAKGATIGLQLVGIGLFLAVAIAIYKHKFLGIFEIMTSIQVFADIMSYLRLFALGLAGAIVAATINELSAGLPLVFAAILVVISHMINIVLCIMGGVIHGLRLNFLEWYHWSFEGGGKLFKPLRLFKIDE